MGKELSVLAVVMFTALAGCATTKGSFCSISSPFRLSSSAVDALSYAEVKAMLAHNRKGQALCGWAP